MPEFGSDIEVIEPANPRTYYDSTRRKLGMVSGIDEAVSVGHQTSLPNVFMVGDTVSSDATVEAVIQSALLLVKKILSQE